MNTGLEAVDVHCQWEGNHGSGVVPEIWHIISCTSTYDSMA